MPRWEESGFEWDEDKRRSNIVKHDIDFVRAQDLFDGRPLTHLPSTYEEEPRQFVVGDPAGSPLQRREMNRRTFLIGVAATVAVSLPGHTAMGQDAAVIQRAAVRARREFLSRHIDMRTDAYLFDAQDDARAGFTRLSSWAAKPEPNGDIVVGNIEDITETDDGTFGHRGNPSYPEFGSNVWDVRFYRGKRTDAGPGGTVLTMVLLSGPVVHVWRAITSVSDSLLRQIEIFFENYGFPKQQYTDVQLLACLPTVDDLTYLDANISKIKMTLEEVTPLD